MKFDKFTLENNCFSLRLKLRLNPVYIREIRVENQTFPVISIDSFIQLIFLILFHKKVTYFRVKYSEILKNTQTLNKVAKKQITIQ